MSDPSEIARLTKRIRELEDEVREVRADLLESEREAEMFMLACQGDERAEGELRGIREFFADVRRGIRDLSEYDDVCGEVYR